MSVGDGNGATGYQVTYSGLVQQEVMQLRAGLGGAEEVRRFDAALRVIHSRLRTDPTVFGEHQYSLSHLQATVREAAVRPLVVSFAVHDTLPVVFVRWFKLLGGNKP
jgi:hypothetical protein